MNPELSLQKQPTTNTTPEPLQCINITPSTPRANSTGNLRTPAGILSLNNMPFSNITNYELISEFLSSTNTIRQKLDQCNLNDYLCKNLSQEICETIDCKYYNENSLNQLLTKCEPECSIMHLNIRSLNKHRSKLISFLDKLDKEFDIIALTEIGKKNIDNNLAFFDGYQSIYECSRTNFGGACIMAKNNLQITERSDLKISTNTKDLQIEDLWVEIRYEGKTKPLLLGVVYRHPNTPIENFNKAINKTIETITTDNKNIIICGDFNINLLNNTMNHQTPSKKPC
jgi:hypothetical protein